jgi:4a-hydroxytetrahydrobiopterin dehydratase
MESLREKKCVACDGGTPKLDPQQITELLTQVHGWELVDGALHRDLELKGFAQVMQLANAIAWIAEREDHHPDMNIHGWKKLGISLSTHAVGGLTENDFVLAAKIDALLE